MATQNDDRQGAKPYKTYKATGRAKRTPLDDELAGARPPSRRSPRADEAPVYPERSDKAYRTYGPAPGSKAAKKQAQKAAKQARRRRFRWWYIPVTLLALLVIAGVVFTVLAWPGYQKFDRAVDKANKRVDKKTSAQLTADDGWIWRNGTTVVLFGLDSRACPAHSDTIMLMHFDAKKHKINQLSIPRDTLVDVPGYGQAKLTEAMWYGGTLARAQDRQAVHGHPHQPHHDGELPGVPAPRELGRRHRHVRAGDGHDRSGSRQWRAPRSASSPSRRACTTSTARTPCSTCASATPTREGDFTRAARQQAFVQAIQKKLMRPGNIFKLPEIGKHFMSGVATDLTTNQIMELAYLKWRVHRRHQAGDEGRVRLVQPAVRRPAAERRRQAVHDQEVPRGVTPGRPAAADAPRRSSLRRSGPRRARGRGPELSGPCGGARRRPAPPRTPPASSGPGPRPPSSRPRRGPCCAESSRR